MAITLDHESGVQLYDLHPPLDDFRAAVLDGLNQTEKTISPKFLYDKRGAELFDAICTLDEYYLTRTEVGILCTYAQEIADLIKEGVLIEFGSGSSQKIRILLDTMLEMPTYIALDISKQHLQESCQNLVKAYPGLKAIAICADYTQLQNLPEIASIQPKHKVGFFPGSSIGNLEPEEAVQFLKNTASLLGSGGSLLIGVDLQKSATILEPAYDDPQGISAAFALNLLTRINRELGANFDLNQFGYNAFYNTAHGRIEMYIISREQQTVCLGNVEIQFQAGERLRTEYSYKYTIPQFAALAAQAGFETKQVWTDPNEWFSLHCLSLP
jgi:dimethylhistidine N-methyltransferase